MKETEFTLGLRLNKDALTEVLDRPIAFHRVFADITGSIPAALFLSQSLYWQLRCPAGRDGWWWKTAKDWFEETRLTRGEQAKARKKLCSLQILEEQKKGVPCRLWFRLNLNALLDSIQNATTRKAGFTDKQVARDAAGKFAKQSDASEPEDGEPISETSPEISPDISYDKPAAEGDRDRTPARDACERLSFELIFGLRWEPNWSIWLDESRATRILFAQGARDSDQVRRVVAEWVAMGTRGFQGDPAAALIWACKSDLSHTLAGDENLPSFA